MENIFIVNHLMQREKREKEEKVYASFVDLKTAFDNVRREKLWECLKRKEVKQEIVRSLKGIYEETRSAVRTNKGIFKKFITNIRVRRMCIKFGTI